MNIIQVCNYNKDWWDPKEKLGWMIKYDGVHIYKNEGKVLTRRHKALPNNNLRKILENILPDGIHAEIACKNPYDPNCFSKSQSFAMSHEYLLSDCIKDGMHIYLFNYFGDNSEVFCNKNFMARHRNLKKDTIHSVTNWLSVANYFIDENKLMKSIAEEEWKKGGEGIIVFPLDAPYYHGRCSKTKPYCTRIKKRDTAEGIIIGVLPEYYGYGKTIPEELRGTQKELAGKLTIRSKEFNEEFNVAGMKKEEKDWIWKNKDNIIGRQITFSYMDKGTKEKPRQPSFIGFRED